MQMVDLQVPTAQGSHPAGKPSKVGKFDISQGKVLEKNCGLVVV